MDGSKATKAGLWIDHRKAIIVAITDTNDEVKLLLSAVERRPTHGGAPAPDGAHESRVEPSDARRQRAFTSHLNTYYAAVMASLGEAEAILIFGPGEAKGELKKRLEKNNLGGRIVAVETVDKMTGRQVAAKTHRYFDPPKSRKL